MRPQPMQTAAGYQGVLESPLPGQYLKDVFEVSGWLQCEASGQGDIFLFVDEWPLTGAVTQLPRPDIASRAADSGAINPSAGFLSWASCKGLTPGRHVVAVVMKVDGKPVAHVQVPVIFEEPKRFISVWDGPTGSLHVNGFLQVDGYVFCAAPARIRIYIDGQPAEAEFQWGPRPNSASKLPQGVSSDPNSQFTASLFTESWEPGPHTVALVAEIDGEALVLESMSLIWEEPLPLRRYIHLTPGATYRRAKLEETLGVLACPGCRGRIARTSDVQLRCTGCGNTYPLVNLVPVMVSGQPTYPVVAAELSSPASNHPYHPSWFRILHEMQSTPGLALDIGSGRRSFGFDRLIQLEICNYPFTDVVNQGATLPFQDESFDVILCSAVTEHVRQPWVLAAEIQRVAKPGALICVDSAFLQPLHGYPEHFFNMTAQGLASLFPDVEVQSLRAEANQHPWFSLLFILNGLRIAASDAQVERLYAMTVGELFQHLNYFLLAKPNLLSDIALPPTFIEACAAGHTLVGRKSAGKAPPNPP